MLRKILISLAGIAFASAFIACQSDEGITGPVDPGNPNQDDAEAGCWGYIRYPGGEPVYPAEISAYDVSLGPPAPLIERGPTGILGWYQLIDPVKWSKSEDHYIMLVYSDGSNWGYHWFWYYADDAHPYWICLELPYP